MKDEDRFGPNGAVMGAMSDEMKEEYRKANRIDFDVGDVVPTVVFAALMPFLLTASFPAALGPAWGAVFIGVSLLAAAGDLRRLKSDHPSDWSARQRWSRADARTRVAQIAMAILLPIGTASLLSPVFGQ